MTFPEIVTMVDGWVWGPVMLVLLVGTGIYLTIRTKFLCWRNLGYSIKSTLSKDARKTNRGEGDVSPFACLCTALAATIGTGNIAGVASALAAGGPGALVWMWISAAFGITSKFTECALAVKYRVVNSDGEMLGGPMITAEYGIPKAYNGRFKGLGKFLGIIFALFTVFASFGIGNLSQGSSISDAVHTVTNAPLVAVAIVIGLLVLAIVLGGLKRISKVSSVVVPVMAIFYVIGGLIIILVNITALPAAIVTMFRMAFSVHSVGGGLVGSMTASIVTAMQKGVARGCFSNEAGMGSAAITSAAATTDNHVRQGYINSTGTFWDTLVVCSITGLAIITSGVLGTTNAEGDLISGPSLTIAAFKSVMGPLGGWLVAIALFLFAFSTILGWEYHGEKALEYLTPSKSVKLGYRLIFSVIAFVGCITSFGVAIDISDILNALMIVPNAIIMWMLVGPLVKDMEDFEVIRKAEADAKNK